MFLFLQKRRGKRLQRQTGAENQRILRGVEYAGGTEANAADYKMIQEYAKIHHHECIDIKGIGLKSICRSNSNERSNAPHHRQGKYEIYGARYRYLRSAHRGGEKSGHTALIHLFGEHPVAGQYGINHGEYDSHKGVEGISHKSDERSVARQYVGGKRSLRGGLKVAYSRRSEDVGHNQQKDTKHQGEGQQKFKI